MTPILATIATTTIAWFPYYGFRGVEECGAMIALKSSVEDRVERFAQCQDIPLTDEKWSEDVPEIDDFLGAVGQSIERPAVGSVAVFERFTEVDSILRSEGPFNTYRFFYSTEKSCKTCRPTPLKPQKFETPVVPLPASLWLLLGAVAFLLNPLRQRRQSRK